MIPICWKFYLKNFSVSSFAQDLLQLEVYGAQFDSAIDDIVVELNSFSFAQARGVRRKWRTFYANNEQFSYSMFLLWLSSDSRSICKQRKNVFGHTSLLYNRRGHELLTLLGGRYVLIIIEDRVSPRNWWFFESIMDSVGVNYRGCQLKGFDGHDDWSKLWNWKCAQPDNDDILLMTKITINIQSHFYL